MLDIISFALHYFFAIIFFILIPLPVFLRVSETEGENWLRKVTKIYKKILMIAHVALLVQIATGFVLRVDFSHWWTYAVLVIWVGIGAFLGLTQKYLRLIEEDMLEKRASEEPFAKARRFSTFLTLSIIAMFVLKYVQFG